MTPNGRRHTPARASVWPLKDLPNVKHIPRLSLPGLLLGLLLLWLTVGFGVLVSETRAAGKPARQSQTPVNSCLAPASWTIFDDRQAQLANSQQVLADLVRRDVVLLGEQHDDADHHRWQLQVIAGLHAQRPEMVIGFEMFPRRVQPVLDRWVAGELTVKEFLARSEWDKVWNIPAEIYLPLFHFARLNRIPMLALNIDEKLTRAIAEKGWEAVPTAEREGIGRAAPASVAYREFLFEVYRQHATMRGKSGKVSSRDPAFAYFLDSQLAWDRAMAEALARQAVPAADGVRPLLVGVMGSGHLRFGHGVPHQLRALGVGSIGTLLPMSATAECGDLKPGIADAVFAVPTLLEPPAEPPRLGVELDDSGGRVLIARVSAGSLAEQSGLKAGDQILEIAGKPVSKMSAVLTSIRRQPAGTWLPMQIQRAERKLEVVVRFPAR